MGSTSNLSIVYTMKNKFKKKIQIAVIQKEIKCNFPIKNNQFLSKLTNIFY